MSFGSTHEGFDARDQLVLVSFGGALRKGVPRNPSKLLISQHGGNIVLFSAMKDQNPPNKGSATDALVWRKYRMLGGDIIQDIPKHVLITSPAVTKGGTTRTKHFALVCNSSVPLKIRRARSSDSPTVITKPSAKTASLESLQEANELPQHW